MSENYVAMVVTMIIVWVLGYDGLFSRTDSIVLLLLFVLYLYFLYKQEKQHSHHAAAAEEPVNNIGLQILYLLIGMGILLASSAVTLESVQYIVNAT
ncbi:MAG: hypothetical protein H6765_06485 [Candidatus Peribacteria bacterium]|nr:MAG: hypothetical protein H6765_06485 [Candidatus Peribacteria bacterium]